MLLNECLLRSLVAIDKTAIEHQVRRTMRAMASQTAAFGLPSCTFHSLRKSRATALVMRGADIRQVARWLGHATVAVTWLSYVRTLA